MSFFHWPHKLIWISLVLIGSVVGLSAWHGSQLLSGYPVHAASMHDETLDLPQKTLIVAVGLFCVATQESRRAQARQTLIPALRPSKQVIFSPGFGHANTAAPKLLKIRFRRLSRAPPAY